MANWKREIPFQDFNQIREGVYRKKGNRRYLLLRDLFVDPSFPPDWSSLSYVYSGDDKYEQTIFKRPIDIVKSPVFVGVGGVTDEPFPWQSWKQRSWFYSAVLVIAHNIKYMEKIIRGYKNFEQSFESRYIGAFSFQLWRFGEWVEVIVDDYLPISNNTHLFSHSIGNPPEFWGCLIEKAYAKCKKTFQAIEYGCTLDALTDLTGGVCEFYSPDINPPEHLFHILYKSNINRSLMVCWRNNKRLTESAFDFDDFQKETNKSCKNEKRYLHTITAVTKLPMTDKRSLEMVRLKCVFSKEPKWKGRFSELDAKSWNTINTEFKEKFRPLSRKDDDEYWLTMEDFRCNFGGLFIISHTEPYTTDGLKLDRKYKLDLGPGFRTTEDFQDTGKSTSKTSVCREKYIVPKVNSTDSLNKSFSTDSCFAFRNPGQGRVVSDSMMHSQKILIQEAPQKFDNSDKASVRIPTYECIHSNEITFSSSEISLQFQLGHQTDDYNRPSHVTDDGCRVQSIRPHTTSRNNSDCSLGSLTQSHFLATKTDFFKQQGQWRMMFEHKGGWTRDRRGVSRKDMDSHSKSPRIFFSIPRINDAIDINMSHKMHGKRHVIISLLQDYRHGASTANNLLLPIGFCLYRAKYIDRDDKRHLSKLQLNGQVESHGEVREVNARFDLEAGGYILVPYCLADYHEGEYMIRILAEWELPGSRGECSIS